MPDNADLVRGWLRKMLEDQDGPYDAARFRAQQDVYIWAAGIYLNVRSVALSTPL